ncbi:MAG: ankyrin repeat domain-containing protein [Ignavibacteriales bacterium]|nr:ankyrin repeat domain-containing protein [Ignavibacteriales bacterium]
MKPFFFIGILAVSVLLSSCSNFLQSVRTGNYEEVKESLSSGTSANTSDDHSFSALMIASSNGHLDMVKLLVEKGADVNAASIDGVTPLGCAAYGNKLDVAKLLIEHGAKINYNVVDTTTASMTPLIAAVQNKEISKSILEYLLDNGADVNSNSNLMIREADDHGVRVYDSFKPIYIAAALGNKEIVEFLKSKGAVLPRGKGVLIAGDRIGSSIFVKNSRIASIDQKSEDRMIAEIEPGSHIIGVRAIFSVSWYQRTVGPTITRKIEINAGDIIVARPFIIDADEHSGEKEAKWDYVIEKY